MLVFILIVFMAPKSQCSVVLIEIDDISAISLSFGINVM